MTDATSFGQTIYVPADGFLPQLLTELGEGTSLLGDLVAAPGPARPGQTNVTWRQSSGSEGSEAAQSGAVLARAAPYAARGEVLERASVQRDTAPYETVPFPEVTPMGFEPMSPP